MINHDGLPDPIRQLWRSYNGAWKIGSNANPVMWRK
jgi:hypothetical protein